MSAVYFGANVDINQKGYTFYGNTQIHKTNNIANISYLQHIIFTDTQTIIHSC